MMKTGDPLQDMLSYEAASGLSIPFHSTQSWIGPIARADIRGGQFGWSDFQRDPSSMMLPEIARPTSIQEFTPGGATPISRTPFMRVEDPAAEPIALGMAGVPAIVYGSDPLSLINTYAPALAAPFELTERAQLPRFRAAVESAAPTDEEDIDPSYGQQILDKMEEYTTNATSAAAGAVASTVDLSAAAGVAREMAKQAGYFILAIVLIYLGIKLMS